jgi:hypothetical protein
MDRDDHVRVGSQRVQAGGGVPAARRADTKVGMPSSSPVQWNQVGTTRGVPSTARYATRAGMVQMSRRLAT